MIQVRVELVGAHAGVFHDVERLGARDVQDGQAADVPPPIMRRHFHKAPAHDGLFQVSEATRSLVRLARLNLLAGWPMRGPFDAIFCRNVMIYFDRPTQETLVNRCHHYLAEGGYLFIGHSESLNSIVHPLKYIRPAVYRKAGAAQGDRKGAH